MEIKTRYPKTQVTPINTDMVSARVSLWLVVRLLADDCTYTINKKQHKAQLDKPLQMHVMNICLLKLTTVYHLDESNTIPTWCLHD